MLLSYLSIQLSFGVDLSAIFPERKMDVVNDSITCFFIVGVCLPRVVSFEDQQVDMLKNALKTVKHYTENLWGCYFHYSIIVQVILKRSKFIKTILQNTNTNIHTHTF